MSAVERVRGLGLPQFIRFVAVGVLNTGFSYAVFAALVWAGMPASIALLLSTIMGIVFNFFTTGRLVFNNRDMRRLWRFLAAYGVVYLINLGLLSFLRSWGLPAVPAQGLCLLAMVPVSFVLQKLFVFREIAHEDH
jgi:putative flippase GtrA